MKISKKHKLSVHSKSNLPLFTRKQTVQNQRQHIFQHKHFYNMWMFQFNKHTLEHVLDVGNIILGKLGIPSDIKWSSKDNKFVQQNTSAGLLVIRTSQKMCIFFHKLYSMPYHYILENNNRKWNAKQKKIISYCYWNQSWTHNNTNIWIYLNIFYVSVLLLDADVMT